MAIVFFWAGNRQTALAGGTGRRTMEHVDGTRQQDWACSWLRGSVTLLGTLSFRGQIGNLMQMEQADTTQMAQADSHPGAGGIG